MPHPLRQAKLKHNACVEEIDYRYPLGLDNVQMLDLTGRHWIKRHLNLLITGPTGVGETWIGCALAQKACREGYTALYLLLPKLLQELSIAKCDGAYAKSLSKNNFPIPACPVVPLLRGLHGCRSGA